MKPEAAGQSQMTPYRFEARRGARPRAGLLLAAVGLCVSGLFCSSGGSSSVTEPADAPNTATLSATAAARSEWPLVVSDDFSKPAHDWETGEEDDRFTTGSLRIADGKYRWDLKANDGFIWWSRSRNNTSATDFYAAVEAQQLTGPDSADYGLVFRWDRGNFYYFQVSKAGKFALSLYYFEKWSTLVSWTETSAIRPGEENRLAVSGEGPDFTFYINGQRVGEADDDRLPGGTVGVAIELNQAGDKATFEFDNFEWRAPPGSVSVTPAP